MKTWMKIAAGAMWFGLGGGIGFFAGYRMGMSNKAKTEQITHDEYEKNETFTDEFFDRHIEAVNQRCNDVIKVMREYVGVDGDCDGDEAFVATKNEEDDAEMPEETPRIGDEDYIDEDIPQLHEQHLIPVQITEEEYYNNPWNYDQEQLLYYDTDKVLFNKDTRTAFTNKDDIDQAIGIGMTFQFYQNGETVDAIFVKNDTMGVIFRIDRIDGAYDDEISGANAPEYEEDDE